MDAREDKAAAAVLKSSSADAVFTKRFNTSSAPLGGAPK